MNRIWGEALEYGVQGTRPMQGLYGALTKPTFGDKACPHYSATISDSFRLQNISPTTINFGHYCDVAGKQINLFELAVAITSLKF